MKPATPSTPPPAPQLSRAERELLLALATGASNKALAQRLGKSSHTVRNQLSSLFKKIGVANRTQALVWQQVNMNSSSPAAQTPAQPTSTATQPPAQTTPVSFARGIGTTVLLPAKWHFGTMLLTSSAPTPSQNQNQNPNTPQSLQKA